MSDLGTRIHALVEWTAPPIDGYEITRGRAPRPARWVPILAAFVAVLVIGGFTFVFGGWQPGDPVADATSIPVDVTDPVVDVTSPDTTLPETSYPLSPIRIDCTAELQAFPCVALIDADPSNEWQAVGDSFVSLVFYFSPGVSIDRIGFRNLPDEERFLRNGNIRDVEVHTNDGFGPVTFELVDSNDEIQWIDIGTTGLSTTRLSINVESTYPGVRVGELEPFGEVALAEIIFQGRRQGGPVDQSGSFGVDPESALIIGIMESGPVPELVACPGGSQHLGTVEMMSFPTPPLALEEFLISFDGGAARLATAGYVELGQADGSIVYGKPLNRSNLDEGYSTLITVQPRLGNQWTVTSWEASVC